MQKITEKIKEILPTYGILPLLFSFLFNCLVYGGSRMIAGDWFHHQMDSALDAKIPFCAPFLLVYFGCYLFWAVNYILIARQDREAVYRFFTGDFLSRCICFVIFLVYPTTNVRPVIPDKGFWNRAVLWLYSIDAADNLFPSIHCLVSWFCYLGIRHQKEIPVWYKKISFFFAILVFASTLFLKQHVILDVVGGVLLAEVCFYIGKKTNGYQQYEKIAKKGEKLFFERKKKDL